MGRHPSQASSSQQVNIQCCRNQDRTISEKFTHQKEKKLVMCTVKPKNNTYTTTSITSQQQQDTPLRKTDMYIN